MIKTTIRQFVRSNLPLLIFIISPLLLLTLFFNINEVNADTINITITDHMFSYLEHINDYISSADSSCQSVPAINCMYFIRYHNDVSYQNLYLLVNYGGLHVSPMAYLSSGTLRANNENQKFVFGSDYSLSSTSSYYNSSDWRMFEDGSSTRLFLYASFDLPFRSVDNNTYVFTYNNSTYSVVNDGTNFCPTLYDLYQIFYTPPEPTPPPDETPILTSFVDLSLEKIALICNFFTSSYVYLFVFVIFILYFVIYLVRRLSQ